MFTLKDGREGFPWQRRWVKTLFATGMELNQSPALTETKAGIVLQFLFLIQADGRQGSRGIKEKMLVRNKGR